MSLSHDSMLSGRIIAAAMEVHSALGPGLLERAYIICLRHELQSRGIDSAAEVPVPLEYKGVYLGVAYRMDLVVERAVVVEVKTVVKLHPVHASQLLSYLKMSGINLGLLMNFHVQSLRDGLKADRLWVAVGNC